MKSSALTKMLRDSKSYKESLMSAKLSQARFESGLMSNILEQFNDEEINHKEIKLEIYGCALRAAGHGLLPGAHCAITGRWDKRKNRKTAVLYIQYQGIIHRISQMDNVSIAAPQVIVVGDEYQMPTRTMDSEGWNVKFEHIQKYESEEVLYSYVWWSRNGQWDITMVPKSRLDKVAAMNPKSIGWSNSYIEMAKKHAIKVAVKYLDIDPGLQADISQSDDIEEEAADAVVERAQTDTAATPPAQQLEVIEPEESPLGVVKPKKAKAKAPDPEEF